MNKPLNFWKLPGYKPGQNIVCKVVAIEKDGYRVQIPKDNLPGFLLSKQKIKVGEEILAEFVRLDKNRVFLHPRLSGAEVNFTNKIETKQEDWQEQFKKGVRNVNIASEQSQFEIAFMTFAENKPQASKFRRAIDWISSPIEGKLPSPIKVSDNDLGWLINNLEGGMHTGCIKVFSEEVKSRSAALIYRGRVIGCIYGNKTLTEADSTEGSLQKLMKDLSLTDTTVVIYDLPEELILAMSALFVGEQLNRTDENDSQTYFDYIVGWLKEKEQTACIALSLPTKSGEYLGEYLGFVYKGKFIGSFSIESQKHFADISPMFNLIEKNPQTLVQVSILPAENTSKPWFGHSLNMCLRHLNNNLQ